MAFLICFKEWGSKLSLKDRLKTTQKTTISKPKQEQPLKYYNSNEEIPQNESLGIVDSLLIDDEINSIFVSGAKNIYIEKKGKTYKSTSAFRDNVQLENLVRKIAHTNGVDLSVQNSFKFNYKQGINIFATLPPLSDEVTLCVKSYYDNHSTLAKLQEGNNVSKEIALILEALCTIKKNILIIGEKSTLKTTLLSAMVKKVPTNNRVVIIDNQCEFKNKNSNTTNYDFTKITTKDVKEELLSQILSSAPDRLFINDNSNEILSKIINKLSKSYKGFITSLQADNAQDAIEFLIQNILKNNTNISSQKAKNIALNAFDLIITTKKDDTGRRYIGAISEIDLSAEDNFIKDIFVFDCINQYKSTGIIPKFYKDVKDNSLPISDNIFDENYKHTYNKSFNNDSFATFGKKGNIEILKKFKKDLPTVDNENQQSSNPQNTEENIKNDNSPQLDEEFIAQKVQEKFNEIKNNVQSSDEQNPQNEIFSIEENSNE